jgi:hypothetical protein
MAVGRQELDLQCGADSAGDEGSPREVHNDRFSSTPVSGDNVFTSLICNPSTCGRTTGNVLSGTHTSFESDKGDMNPLINAIANLDICKDNVDNRKFGLRGSTEEREQHDYVNPWLHSEKDIKAVYCSKDLVCKPTDEVPEEEREGYPEVKHDSACSAQLNINDKNTGVSLCSPDLHISVNSNTSVNGSDSAHGTDISEPTSCSPYGKDAVGLFTCNGTRDATETFSRGSKNEAEAEIHRIATEKCTMNYVTLPNEVSMPSFIINKPETLKMDVECGKRNTELFPIESISVSQTYAPEISTTSSFDSDVNFSQTVPRCMNESMSVSQSSSPSLPVGISTLAAHVPSTGTCSHNTSTSKIVCTSDSCAAEPATVCPQLSPSCSNIKDTGAIPKNVTCSADMNYTLQGLADNTKFDVSVPLKNKQTNACGICDVFSRAIASEPASIQAVPLKCPVSSDSCIWGSVNKSTATVLDNSSRESSVVTGITFCTLGSPISSSSVSGLFDASFPLSTTSSELDRGRVFKCMAPCTESAVAAAGSVENTCLKPGFTAEVKMCSDAVDTPAQNTKCSMTSESSGLPAWSFFSPDRRSLPISTNNVFSFPNTNPFGKELGVTSVSSLVSSTKVTNGFQFGKHTSLSVTGTGTTFVGFGPHSSKLGFGPNFHSPKYKPLQNPSLTKSPFGNVLPVTSTWGLRAGCSSSLFPSGSSEPKQNDASNCAVSNGHSFGTSSAAAPSHKAFSFNSSKCNSQMNPQRRSGRSRRFREFLYPVLI